MKATLLYLAAYGLSGAWGIKNPRGVDVTDTPSAPSASRPASVVAPKPTEDPDKILDEVLAETFAELYDEAFGSTDGTVALPDSHVALREDVVLGTTDESGDIIFFSSGDEYDPLELEMRSGSYSISGDIVEISPGDEPARVRSTSGGGADTTFDFHDESSEEETDSVVAAPPAAVPVAVKGEGSDANTFASISLGFLALTILVAF